MLCETDDSPLPPSQNLNYILNRHKYNIFYFSSFFFCWCSSIVGAPPQSICFRIFVSVLCFFFFLRSFVSFFFVFVFLACITENNRGNCGRIRLEFEVNGGRQVIYEWENGMWDSRMLYSIQ